jgi:hypothetical protein
MTVLSSGRSRLRSWAEARRRKVPYPEVSMGRCPYSAREVMEPASPVPALPESQSKISLKDGLAAFNVEFQEDGNGNR